MLTKTAKIIIITAVAVAISLIILSDFFVLQSRFYGTKTITVSKGEGLRKVADNLQKERVINSSLIFTIYAVATNNAKNVRVGQYEFDGTENIPGVIAIITKGRVVEKQITIIEGWNLADIGEYVDNLKIGNADEFFKLAGKPLYLNRSLIREDCQGLIGEGINNYNNEYSFLADKPGDTNLEGYLFPDSYRISFGADIMAVIKIMLDNFDRKLTPALRAEIKRQDKSIAEIVTMASLLEREVKTLSEKQIVAGILWKRLSIGMPLQVDSTVLYSLGPRDRVSYVDTATCSPYNTYRRKGLPIGPISNPGIDSIMAAIYPEKSDYLYYLSTKDGRTLFSRTLEEHNIKKEKYLR
ncbi:MAG: endolytic transglycosylase MltG [bacterium]